MNDVVININITNYITKFTYKHAHAQARSHAHAHTHTHTRTRTRTNMHKSIYVHLCYMALINLLIRLADIAMEKRKGRKVT